MPALDVASSGRRLPPQTPISGSRARRCARCPIAGQGGDDRLYLHIAAVTGARERVDEPLQLEVALEHRPRSSPPGSPGDHIALIGAPQQAVDRGLDGRRRAAPRSPLSYAESRRKGYRGSPATVNGFVFVAKSALTTR
jgi:hypothetical protein